MTFRLTLSRPFTAGTTTVERVLTIKPTKGAPYIMHPVLSLPIGDLLAGDEIEVNTASCQVSSKMPYNLMIASVLIVTPNVRTSPASGTSAWGAYLEVAEGVGQNITNNVHHFPVNRTARFTMPYDMAGANLVLLVYAASTAYDGSSLVVVDQDYGRLEGAVHRAASQAEVLAFLGLPPAEPVAPSTTINVQITDPAASAMLGDILTAFGDQPQ